MTGIQAFLELLAAAQVRYIFGNPGTTELPLNDALCGDSRFEYILGLQEIPLMAAADGYAMASGKLGVVNLHVACGLGNAMGMLYNAYREGTPLLVTAGQQDRRLRFEEPILGGDMVEVARPWTKWSYEVTRVEDLPNAVRRAMQLALAPPTGPVFLSLPLDVQRDDASRLDLAPSAALDYRAAPPHDAVRKAVELLAQARNPAILCGSRVVESHAVPQLVELAELLGAPVYGEPAHTNGRQPFPCDHPLYGQALPHWSPDIRKVLEPFDVLFCVGLDVLRLYVHFEPERAVPPHCRIVQLDADAYQVGKNYPAELGLVGHLQPGLEAVSTELQRHLSLEQKSDCAKRAAKWHAQHVQQRGELQQSIVAEKDRRPMTARTLMSAIAPALPHDVAVIEEAVTTTGTLLQRMGALPTCDGYFAHRGWALGWGLNCALGVKLAWPHRPVLAILGEGAAMYGIQGLWTAARYNLPVTYVIANNAQYQILKGGAQMLGLPAAQENRFVGMELREPEVDIVGVARSLGVQAETITEPDTLSDALHDSLAGSKPRLINVPIERGFEGE